MRYSGIISLLDLVFLLDLIEIIKVDSIPRDIFR